MVGRVRMDGTVRIGLLWALVGVVLWSFSLPFTKAAVEGFNPFTVAAGRGVIAGLLAVPVLLLTRRRIPPRHLWGPLAWTVCEGLLGPDSSGPSTPNRLQTA